jgi:hypothetical protein
MLFQNKKKEWCKMRKINTERVSTETGWKLMADICHKAESNELLRKALKKIANMNQKSLLAFLGEAQVIFGRLKKVVSNISLEATGFFNTRDFFKTKSEGGIFAYVDQDIFGWFDDEIKDSPAKEFAGYEFTEDITEESIVGDAKAGGIYEEMDFAHIRQVCERHFSGEKLLKEGGSANLFWTRNKNGELCWVGVWLSGDGWVVGVFKFNPSDGWGAGGQSFFRN